MDLNVNKSVNQASRAENDRQWEKEKKRKWRDPNEDVKYVCQGGKIQCKYCSSPIALLTVTAETVMLQDKPWATIGDNVGKVNFGFTGICTHPKWGNQKPPCKSVINLGQWKDFSETFIGNHNALLVKSSIPCMVSSESLKIVHSGQTATLRKINPLDQRNAVIEIKVITPLEKGSFNNGTNKIGKLGFIYGQTYTLEATNFSNGIPCDKEIKWEAGFIFSNGSMGNVCYKGSSEKWRATGKRVEFSVKDLSLLGGTIVFYAYIDRPRSEASLEVWVHYRFRFFDFKKVQSEVHNRMREPWLIDQSGTSLCGMAALFYVFVKSTPSLYEKFVTDLHHKGVAAYNGYVVEPYENSKKIMYDMNPNSGNYPVSGDGKQMPMADWISLAVLRSHESTEWIIPVPTPLFPGFTIEKKTIPYSGENEESAADSLAAVNWPTMMERLCKDFLGYSNVDSIGLSLFLLQQKKRPLGGRLYDKLSDSDLQHLQDMDNAYKNGAEIIMMIDSQMFENIVSYSYKDLFTHSHWIVYEGRLKFYDDVGKETKDYEKAKSLSFCYFTWGYNPFTHIDMYKRKDNTHFAMYKKISVDSFKSTYYGYIKCI